MAVNRRMRAIGLGPRDGLRGDRSLHRSEGNGGGAVTLATAKHCFHERKEKNYVKQLLEAIDTRCGIGGYCDGIFIRGSRRRDKYQPRRGVEFLRRSAIK